MLPRDVLTKGPRAFVHPARVAFADSLGNGRIFYPKLFGLFHDAYEAMLEAHAVPLTKVLRDRAGGGPLVHTRLEIPGELPAFGAKLEVVVAAAELHEHTVSFGYRAHDAGSGEVVALGSSTHAFVDLATMKKAPVSDAVRAMLDGFPAGAVTSESTLGRVAPEDRKALVESPARHTLRVGITFDDVDAAGFVYFARTCSLFHRAYADMRRKRGERIDECGGKPTSRITATDASFMRPLRAGDEADVHIVSSAHAEDVATLGFRVVAADGTPVAIGTLAHAGAGAVELPPAP